MLTSIATVLFLCFMEGLLSLDNALALAVMVKPLPPHQQKKALSYGIYGAFAFRAIAMLFMSKIIRIGWIKIVGGGYLLFMAAKYFVTSQEEKEPQGGSVIPHAKSLIYTIISVELMDIAFSIDSILTAVCISDTYWILLTGGIMGIIMMRFAATFFIRLLKWFPKLEVVAYVLIAVIGAKLMIEQLLRGVL